MTAIERPPLTLQLNVVFRFAEREDLPKLEWFGKYAHFRRVFQQAYADQLAGRRLMLLAVVNDFPIGQVFMQLESVDDNPVLPGKRGYFYSLRVMDMFQRQGIGTTLLQESETILRSYNYRSVSIAAAKDNPGARKLYERLGYRVFMEDAGRWDYLDHEGKTRKVHEPCWVLEKML